MAGIKEYLFGVIAAAIVCAVVSHLAGEEGFLSAAMKLITGVFMLLALISPVFKVQISSPTDYLNDISLQADRITSSAEVSSRDSISDIIKERTQAYILDKAKTYGVSVSAQITLSEGDIPEPVSVTLSGSVSPYKKKILSQMIETDLGIPAEAQIWN